MGLLGPSGGAGQAGNRLTDLNQSTNGEAAFGFSVLHLSALQPEVWEDHNHDLWLIFAPHSRRRGQGLPIIDKPPGHAQAQSTVHYAHRAIDPARMTKDAVSQNLR